MQRVEVVLGIICANGEVLVCRRHDTGAFAGLWEFPGGKRETNESVTQTLARELNEELGIQARITDRLDSLDFDYPSLRVRLIPLLCAVEIGEPKPLASQEVKWIPYERLGELAFPQANAPLIQQIIAHLSGSARVDAAASKNH